jgi:hypothetical protein
VSIYQLILATLQDVIHVNLSALLTTPKSSKSCCVHITQQISTMSLSNNVPLRVYAHTTGCPGCMHGFTNSCWCWPQPSNLFFSQINTTTHRHIRKLAILQLDQTSPGSDDDFLCSCKTDEQGHSDSYMY